MGKGWKVAVAGECMINRTFSQHDEPEFLKIKEIMDDADVCYGHLETVFGKYKDLYPARGNFLGTYLLADPAVAKDLSWLGIDMMSAASNHSYDFGSDGIISTLDACEEAGIACAGIGRDLEEAREPVFKECKSGRAALIAASTGNYSNELANLSKGNMKARAGVNPVRPNIKYRLPAESADELREIGNKLKILRQPGQSPVPTGMEEGQFRYFVPSENSTVGSYCFEVGDDFAVESSCNERDLRENLRSIEQATKVADLVMVAHHSTAYEYMAKDYPTGYAKEFAHAAIDAGADMVFGHGWHKTLGIEIYKGKPIFYGLGNLFAQSQFSSRVPYDGFETWQHDMDRVTTLRPTDDPLRPGMKPSQATSWWSSALIEVEFDENKQLKDITLHPVELGIDCTKEGSPANRVTGDKTEGRPLLTYGDAAKIILGKFKDDSKQYGTEIEIDGDTAHVKF